MTAIADGFGPPNSLLDDFLARRQVGSRDFRSGWVAYILGEFDTALSIFKVLASQGNTNAQFLIMMMQACERGLPSDDEFYARCTRFFAEKGSAVARVEWWFCCGREGRAQDSKIALSWFRVAVEEGSVLGWYLLAAEMGDVTAQYNLGFMYYHGYGFEQDYQFAVKWFGLAAEQGNIDAQYVLGQMYQQGVGVPQNWETAAKWHQLAAKQGDVMSQVILGLMCQGGLGVSRNCKAARKWHGLAAKQGDSTAQLALARMHHEGEGGPKNFVEACKWGHISAANGNQDAWKILDSAEEKLQPLETGEVLQLVLKWKTAHQDDSQLLSASNRHPHNDY